MYADVVKSSKKINQMSQQEIVEECKKIGVNITRSYISKILNDNIIPTEEISRALEKVLDIDEQLLILEGYLEKAPNFFKKYIDEFLQKNLIVSLGVYDNIREFFPTNTKNVEKEIKKLYSNEIRAKSLLEILKNTDFDIVQDNISNMKMKSKDDKMIMTVNNGIMVDVKDNSMEPTIPKNAKIKYVMQKKYENGDIVYINVNGKFKIRAIVWLGRNLFLYTYNREYTSEIVNFGNYTIIGKVSSCMFKL